MEPHDITSYPLKLPFIRSSKMAKRDKIGNEFQVQYEDSYVRSSQSIDHFIRNSQSSTLTRNNGPNGRAPIEIQLENFRRKAIELGFTQPAHPAHGDEPSALRACNPAMLRSDLCSQGPAPPLFPLTQPTSRSFGEKSLFWSDRFRVTSFSSQLQTCPTTALPGALGVFSSSRSNLDHVGAPSFSLTEDSPPCANSQLPQQPFPLAGEPSTMFGALPHEAGFAQAALPPHCHWTDESAQYRRALRFETTTFSPPVPQTNNSLNTTGFASPRPLWKAVTDNDHFGPLHPRRRLQAHKRRANSVTKLPVKKNIKSGPATSSLLWDSDVNSSPEHQSDPILDRGLLALSPIAKSTPCPVIRHDRRSIKPSERSPSSSSSSASHSPSCHHPQRPKKHKGMQTLKKFDTFVGVNVAVQTDMSTNMPIFREAACSPPPWNQCQNCGCHREVAASTTVTIATVPVSSPVSPPWGNTERPACRSAASSADTEASSFLNDFLIGVEREE